MMSGKEVSDAVEDFLKALVVLIFIAMGVIGFIAYRIGEKSGRRHGNDAGIADQLPSPSR